MPIARRITALIRANDHTSAYKLIQEAKSRGYPSGLIASLERDMRSALESAPRESSIETSHYQEQIRDTGPESSESESNVPSGFTIVEGNDFLAVYCCEEVENPQLIAKLKNYLQNQLGLLYIIFAPNQAKKGANPLDAVIQGLLENSAEGVLTQAAMSRIVSIEDNDDRVLMPLVVSLFSETILLNSRNASLHLEMSRLRRELERVQNAFAKTDEFLNGTFASTQYRQEAYKTPHYGEGLYNVRIEAGAHVYQSLPILSSGIIAIVLIAHGTDPTYADGNIEFELSFPDGGESSKRWATTTQFIADNRFIELALPVGLPLEGLAMKLSIWNNSSCALIMEGHPLFADETMNLQPSGSAPLSTLVFTGMPLVTNHAPEHAIMCL